MPPKNRITPSTGNGKSRTSVVSESANTRARMSRIAPSGASDKIHDRVIEGEQSDGNATLREEVVVLLDCREHRVAERERDLRCCGRKRPGHDIGPRQRR